MKKRVVVFDLDGTLVNSLSDIVAVVNMVRQHYGYDPLPIEQVRSSIGKGIENTRLSAAGKGASDLANKDDPQAAENRRVKIVNMQ